MKILVVVDMQHDFIDMALGTPEAVAIVPNVIDRIKKANKDKETIIFTRDTHPDNYLNTPEGKKLPVEHCIEDTLGWSIPQTIVQAAEQAIVINKPTFGSVMLIDGIAELMEHDNLKQEDLEIEFCGLCTDICVLSNVLLAKTNFPNANIKVNSQLCAGVTPQKHEAALEVMRSCQIDVL